MTITFKKTNCCIFIAVIITVITCIFVPFISQDSFCAAQGNGLEKESMSINGITRTFWVYTPQLYCQDKKSLPVVLVFHGSAADGKKIMNYTKFNKAADKYNFIAVYPEKIDLMDWDLKTVKGNKEIIFVSKLIDHIEKNYRIDKSRVYATGFSSGADLNMMLAGTLSNKIAAFAPVSGNMRKRFIPLVNKNRPVSMLMINGTEDPYDKWNGDNNDQMSIKDSIRFWEYHNKHGQQTPKEIIFSHKENSSNETTATLYIHENPKTKTEVSLLEIKGGGHTWPGAPTDIKTETFLGKTNYDISANDVMYEFFMRHKLLK